MPSLQDQLRHAFSGRTDRVRSALRQSKQERGLIHGAARRYEESKKELTEVRLRTARLPLEHSAATLKRDTAAQERIQAESDRLSAREKELEAEKEKAAGELSNEDPRTAEQLALGRCQQIAHDEVQHAKRERAELIEVLDEALAELEAEAAEAAAIKQEYDRQEAS